MVRIFQRYIPYSSIVDFLVQSLLCLAAFALVVQVAWWTQLDPTLPSLAGIRAGRALTAVSVLLAIFYLTGYFERHHHLNTSMFLPRLVRAIPLSAITLAMLYQFVPEVALSLEVASSGLLLMTVLMIGWHAIAPAVVARDALVENILMIGDGDLASQISERVNAASSWGLRLVGYVPVAGEPATRGAVARATRLGSGLTGVAAVAHPATDEFTQVLQFPIPAPTLDVRSLGRLQDLDAILSEHDIHTIVVALSDRRGKLPLAALIGAKLRGVMVYDATDFYERLTGRMLVSRIRPSSIIFSDGFVSSRTSAVIKRALDIVVATGILAITAPLQVLVAVAVRLGSPGPMLFKQERVGLNGLPFTMLKFRTMRTDAEKNGPQWAAANDPRITGLGGVMRKTRIDELPQLWNVLAGHMSFVGPRPERPVFVRELRAAIPYYDQRHTVRPGLTGWAQVKFPYGASVEDTEEKLEFDLYYIKHMSSAFDITIIFETVRVLLTAKGAR